MKKQVELNLLLILLFMLGASCSKKQEVETADIANISSMIELSPEEIVSIAYDSPMELTQSEVLEIAKDFPLELRPGNKGNFGEGVYSINKKIYLDESGNITTEKVDMKSANQFSLPIYDVDVSNGSARMKAYICADERFPEVLAYIPENPKSKFVISDHPMFLLSLSNAIERVSYINKLKDSLREKTIEKIKSNVTILPESNVFKSIKHLIKSTNAIPTKSLVTETLPTMVINRIGPFTTTLWDQGWDFWPNAYNHKMPPLTCEGSSYTAPAGCVTVAVAQLLAHIRPYMNVPRYTDNSTINVDWNMLKQTPTVDDWDGARYDLMGSLMRCVADGVQSSSVCNGGSASTSADMNNAINYARQFISISNLQDFSTQSCKVSLDNFQTVLASGSRSSMTGTGKIGHAWLVDGYAVCKKGILNGNNGTTDIVNKYDLYLHCNLGWGASAATGWYLVNNDWSVTFDTGSGAEAERQHYRLNLKCAPNATTKIY